MTIPQDDPIYSINLRTDDYSQTDINIYIYINLVLTHSDAIPITTFAASQWTTGGCTGSVSRVNWSTDDRQVILHLPDALCHESAGDAAPSAGADLCPGMMDENWEWFENGCERRYALNLWNLWRGGTLCPDKAACSTNILSCEYDGKWAFKWRYNMAQSCSIMWMKEINSM